ncbi:MAG: DUF1553 domain-containing protein, partial [Verrucomicrobia bacterium]|nr:DUF1553 domain-containing protein [Verrucomicrobiota bacterium]
VIWIRFSLLCITLLWHSQGVAAQKIDFNFHVRPLLSDRCFACHGPDEQARKASLRLDTPEGLLGKRKSGKPIVLPRQRAESELWRRITTTDPEDLMPPSESHLKLSPNEIETLGQWIDQGAAYRKHWAFNPIEKVELPSQAADGSVNEIDRFIRAELANRGLAPSPETSREQWLRRVAFDLTGLPPSLEQLDLFLADKSPDAHSNAVDALLHSNAYGERMASEWLDLARYADTYGYQSDADRDMSAWRDWVIDSFNRNMPWDQFILWQLAGDLLPSPSREQYLATAFNRLHRQTNEGGSIEEEFRAEYVADRVHTAGTAFFGLTLECSRCHDHKYDPISQKDYYRLAAFFNNIDESGLYSHFTQATPTPTLLLYKEGQEEKHRELLARKAEADRALQMAGLRADADLETLRAAHAIKDVLPLPSPVAAYSFDAIVTNRFLNQANSNQTATLSDGPVLTQGVLSNAVLFSGDNSVTLKGSGQFRRTDPFTISTWIRPTEQQPRAVLVHRSRAWTDSGSRGYEVVLDEGRPSFALIHFWPGNAIAIRSRRSVTLHTWTHLTVTYDGSSRAGGMRIYINGELTESEVVRDILHRAEWGDADANGLELTLAGRFRDSGFKGGSMDELKVFDLQLTSSEVRALHTNSDSVKAGTDAELRELHRSRMHEGYRKALAEARKAHEEENTLAGTIRQIMVMKELPHRRTTYLLKRGAYDSPGEAVEPGTPEGILPLSPELPRNRLGLAKWAIDPKNPLTARVAVNRIWKIHFGHGLSATVEDFGAQGQLPTHPALLDWLARRFIESGWDRKALHRLIVLSATYRQSSSGTAESHQKDPENRWYSRGPKHRLSAEQIRDQALAISGLLVPRIGGPSVKPYQPPGVWEEAGTGKTYNRDKGEALYRRSLYTFWRRTAPPPSMLTFDATSREVCTAKRESTSTPLQALVLLNDVQFIEASRVLAEDLLIKHPSGLEPRINEAFRRLSSRQPSQRELGVLLKLFQEQHDYYQARPKEAEALLSQGDKPRNKDLRPEELAATTLLVSSLMNHDEFSNKR